MFVCLCDMNDTSPCQNIKFKTNTYIVRAMGEPIPVVVSSGIFFTSQKRAIEFMLSESRQLSWFVTRHSVCWLVGE